MLCSTYIKNLKINIVYKDEIKKNVFQTEYFLVSPKSASWDGVMFLTEFNSRLGRQIIEITWSELMIY